MSLGAVTVGNSLDAVNDQALFVPVSFPGDSAYPTGGTTAFSTAMATARKGRDIIGIIPQDCGGYHPTYFPYTDLLKVYQDLTAAPDSEVANTTNLSGTTFNLILILR